MTAKRSLIRILVLLATVTTVTAARADQPVDAPFGTAIPMPGIPGTLILVGDGDLPQRVEDEFLLLAGGRRARIVILDVLPDDDHDGSAGAGRVDADALRDRAAHVDVFPLRERDDANDPDLVARLGHASGVWLAGADVATMLERCGSTSLEHALRRVVERGGVVGGAAPLAALAIDEEDGAPKPGLGLLPGYLVHHGVGRGQARTRDLLLRLAERPGHVGLTMDRRTALVVRERQAHVIGRATVRVCLAAGRDRDERIDRVPSGERFDVIQLSRAAVVRAGPSFPPPEPAVAEVHTGTLFLGGGGRLDEDVLLRFVEAAGGAEAPIVVIPTAIRDREALAAGERDAELLRQAGAADVTIVHAMTPAAADGIDVVTPLRTARGIWFSGGRQWRLVDAYLDTIALDLMERVLARGGAIGGASAGATIQGEYLVRGHPLGNRIMMAEGYERGFGFLPGAAIDQHFSQRNRAGDMVALKRRYPQLLGLGLDEGSFAIVTGHVVESAGLERVLVYDGSPTEFTVLETGERYDLRARRKLDEPEP